MTTCCCKRCRRPLTRRQAVTTNAGTTYCAKHADRLLAHVLRPKTAPKKRAAS